MSKVLIITNDYVGTERAGPAIRAWEMATVLSSEHSVILASLSQPAADSDLFKVTHISKHSFFRFSEWADIIIIQPFILWFLPAISKLNKPLVVDIYNVWLIEALEANRNLPLPQKISAHQSGLKLLGESLHNGDYFICSGERQKDYWLGILHYLGRVEPGYYANDPTAANLIGIVPNGISARQPHHQKNVLKGVSAGIRQSDKLLIWGGSVCNWFDPVTLVKAMALLKRYRNDIKLFFMGLKAPNKKIGDHIWSEADKAVVISKKLGVYEKEVFFNLSWIPFAERENYLLEADLGITLHFNNLETRYSFRTRVLDYLWAELPIITSEGDMMSELVDKHNLGRIVPYRDAAKVAEAIVELLDNKKVYQKCQGSIRSIKIDLYWENVMQPLIEYCRNPWRK